jgi:hypothetical protein
MLSFAPPTVNDEMLYSYVARWFALSGHQRVQAFSNAAFSTDIVYDVLNAHRFASLRWTGGMVRDEREVEETMTFVPLARLFLGENAFGRFIDPGDEAPTATASQIALFRKPWRLVHLRYCETCARDHEALIGRGAWLRSHNLPGVSVCHVHGTRLHQQRYRRGHLDLVPSATQRERLSPPKPEELRYSELMARLLSWRGPVIHFAQWEAALSPRLAKYGRNVGRALRNEIEHVYGADFLEGLGLKSTDWSRSPLDRFVCKPICAIHPVFMVLTGELLCVGGIDELIRDAMAHKVTPFSIAEFAKQRAAAKAEEKAKERAKEEARKFKLNARQLAYVLRTRRKRLAALT